MGNGTVCPLAGSPYMGAGRFELGGLGGIELTDSSPTFGRTSNGHTRLLPAVHYVMAVMLWHSYLGFTCSCPDFLQVSCEDQVSQVPIVWAAHDWPVSGSAFVYWNRVVAEYTYSGLTSSRGFRNGVTLS